MKFVDFIIATVFSLLPTFEVGYYSKDFVYFRRCDSTVNVMRYFGDEYLDDFIEIYNGETILIDAKVNGKKFPRGYFSLFEKDTKSVYKYLTLLAGCYTR